jgi:hypothetical protein
LCYELSISSVTKLSLACKVVAKHHLHKGRAYCARPFSIFGKRIRIKSVSLKEQKKQGHKCCLYPCLKGRSGVQFLPLLAAPSFEITVRSQLTEQFVLPDICPHLRVGWHILPLCLRMQIN